MKTQPVEFLEEVVDDVHAAQEFYAAWKSEGAAFFTARLQDTIRWIEWNPEQFPRKYREFRRAIIPRTFYAAFFVIEPDVTTVVAVLDLRQKPQRISQRLRTK